MKDHCNPIINYISKVSTFICLVLFPSLIMKIKIENFQNHQGFSLFPAVKYNFEHETCIKIYLLVVYPNKMLLSCFNILIKSICVL